MLALKRHRSLTILQHTTYAEQVLAYCSVYRFSNNPFFPFQCLKCSYSVIVFNFNTCVFEYKSILCFQM